MSTQRWRDCNPDKIKQANQKYYQNNKEKYLAHVRRRRRAASEYVLSYKQDRKCMLCPEDDPVCLQFHHRDPATKTLSLSIAVAQGWSIYRLQSEIALCDLVCANCHAKLHAKSSGRYRNPSLEVKAS